MANICSNTFYFKCERNLEKYIDIFEKLFEETLDGEITFYDYDSNDSNCGGYIEGCFDSRWSFPEEIFENLFPDGEADDVYFRCLSEEYGCGYVGMSIYSDGSWRDQQTFDL